MADAAPPWFAVVVALGAGAGLRQGEACGLTADRIDFLRRTLTVDRQLVTPAAGPVTLGPPKTRGSYRDVPLADVVVTALAEHVRVQGVGEDGLVVHRSGRPLNRRRFGDVWRATASRAGLEQVRYHDMRHTYASTLLSAGVSIAAVAGWLGHDSPATTLRTYAHFMPADADKGREAIQAAFAAPTVSPSCHEEVARMMVGAGESLSSQGFPAS